VTTIAGAALGSQYRGDKSVALGAVIGLGAALISNIALYPLPKAVGDWSGLHDLTIATIEDQVCLGLLIAVARTRPDIEGSDTSEGSDTLLASRDGQKGIHAMTGADREPSDNFDEYTHRSRSPQLVVAVVATAVAFGLAWVSTTRRLDGRSGRREAERGKAIGSNGCDDREPCHEVALLARVNIALQDLRRCPDSSPRRSSPRARPGTQWFRTGKQYCADPPSSADEFLQGLQGAQSG
jgi:hypothetical protein